MKPLTCLFFIFFTFVAWGYDPMAPPGYNKGTIDNAIQANKKHSKRPTPTSSKKDSLVLRQIVTSDASRSAVINGYIVNVGSYIKNAYVKEISDQSVTLLVKGKKRILTLEESIPRVRR